MDHLSFSAGAARLRFDPDGTLASYAPATRPGTSMLSRCAELSARIDGVPVVWGPPQVVADLDELEVTRDADAGVRATVRHSVEAAWTARLLLVNQTPAPVRLDDVALSVVPAAGFVATGLAADALAVLVVQPADGRGPLLVGRLVSGRQPGVGPDGLRLGSVLLAPGARHVVQWSWELVGTARQAGRPGQLPRTAWLELAQTVTLAAGPDVAVVAPGLHVEAGEDAVELTAPEPGAYRVELRGARGTTALVLAWAPDLDTVLESVGTRLLAARRGPAGAPRLTGGGAGVVVQEALGRPDLPDRGLVEPGRVEDALELLAGAVAEQESPRPLDLAFLAREGDRSGDPRLVDRAAEGVLAAGLPVPGLGLAATCVCLSLVRSGRSVAPVTAHLQALASAPGSGSEPSLAQAAALLEVRLLTRRRSTAASEGSSSDEADTALLLRVGAALGAGLPGRPVVPLPVATVAHLAAVLALVGEDTGHGLRAWWGISAAELGRRAAAEARCRVAGERPGAGVAAETVAWLVLGAALL